MQVDVSVIITCFDKEKYISECINSLIDQSKHPKEIIVVHDGCSAPASHVETTNIIFGKNRGVATARSEGFRFSTGKLVLFIDGDDKVSPDYIEKMTLACEKHNIAYPNVFLSYNNPHENQYVESPWKITATEMMHSCRLVSSSMMQRKVFEELGGFRELPMYEDWDFWLRALCKGFTFKKTDALLWYRQIASTRNRQTREVKERTFARIRSQFIIKRGKLCPKSNMTT